MHTISTSETSGSSRDSFKEVVTLLLLSPNAVGNIKEGIEINDLKQSFSHQMQVCFMWCFLITTFNKSRPDQGKAPLIESGFSIGIPWAKLAKKRYKSMPSKTRVEMWGVNLGFKKGWNKKSENSWNEKQSVFLLVYTATHLCFSL